MPHRFTVCEGHDSEPIPGWAPDGQPNEECQHLRFLDHILLMLPFNFFYETKFKRFTEEAHENTMTIVQCPSYTGRTTFLKRSIHINVKMVSQRPHNTSGDVHVDLGADARQGMDGVLVKSLTIASDVG